jgi:hypothetical protein
MYASPISVQVNSPADALRGELSAIIESIDELQTRVAPQLEARYQAALGRLELQLLSLQIEVQAARRQLELLQSRLNRGEPVTAEWLAGMNAQIAAELGEWQQKMEKGAQALSAAQDYLANLSAADADEVKRVKTAYRRLARYLHPDASPENSDLFERYWPVVQDAYLQIDAALIEALLHLVAHAINERSNKLPAIDSDIELDRLRGLIASQAERLARLKTQAPYCYAEQLRDEIWVVARQAELAAAIVGESERLAHFVIRHSELMAQLGISPLAKEGDD